jgi:hypothetical protein
MPRRFQFSLKDVMRWMLYASLILGAFAAYAHFVGHAQRHAVDQAIRDGRIKPEDR